jgi:hypothetical protein
VTLTPRQQRIAAAAVVLLALGIVLAGLSRVVAGTEHHSFAPGAVPPSSVHVTSGHQYRLSVPGGVDALSARGTDPSTLRCRWSSAGRATNTLDIEASGADTKATNVIASFTAPATGAIHVDCTGWGAVFVDDADNASADLAGLFLVLCVVAFTLGSGLGLSALRSRLARPEAESARPAGDDDEVERFVYLVHVRSEDDEVLDPDRGDVTP